MEFYLDLAFVGVVYGVIGARLLFVLTNLKHFQAFPLEVLYVWSGGLVFYGGFLFAIPCCVLFAKLKKQPYERTYDAIVAPLALGHGIGRIGCLGAGCCHGSPTTMPWGVSFGSDLVDASVRGLSLHPTQLYESAALVLFSFFAGRYLLSKRYSIGKLYPLYMMGYGLVRFTIEIFRGDSVRGFYLGLSTSQWVAILIVLCSVPFVYKNYVLKPRS